MPVPDASTLCSGPLAHASPYPRSDWRRPTMPSGTVRPLCAGVEAELVVAAGGAIHQRARRSPTFVCRLLVACYEDSKDHPFG
jgi:hypothetical protein